jgi:glycerol uptake facilitator-like aquaporin
LFVQSQLFINGSKAQALLTQGRLAEFLANKMAEGVGVMSGILIAGGVSGYFSFNYSSLN